MNREWQQTSRILIADGKNQLVDAIEKIIGYYREADKAGWDVAAIWSMVTRAVATIAEFISTAENLSPEERKQVALAAVTHLYDQVVTTIDLPHVPGFIERRIIDPIGRRILLEMADGAYDALIGISERRMRSTTVDIVSAPY